MLVSSVPDHPPEDVTNARPTCQFGREDAAVLTDVRCCRSGAVGHRHVWGVGCLAPAVGWEREGPSLGVVSTRPATAEDASFLQQMLAVSADWRPSARTDFVIDPATRRIVGFRIATWTGPLAIDRPDVLTEPPEHSRADRVLEGRVLTVYRSGATQPRRPRHRTDQRHQDGRSLDAC
jgi:hypothetical protein